MGSPIPPFGSNSALEMRAGLMSAGPAPGVPLIVERFPGDIWTLPGAYFGYPNIDDGYWLNVAANYLNSFYGGYGRINYGPGTFGPYNILSTYNAPFQAEHKGYGPGSIFSPDPACNGSMIYWHDPHSGDGNNRTRNLGGQWRDIQILGNPLNTNGNVIAFDCGDGWAGRVDHLFIQNFVSPGQKAVRFGNDYFYSEKWKFDNITLLNNATCWYEDSNVTGDESHGYNDIDMNIWLLPNNTVQSGTVIGQKGMTIATGVNHYSGKLRILGNQQTVSTLYGTGAGQFPWILGLVGDNGSGSFSQLAEVDMFIRVEGNGGNAISPYKLYFGENGNQISNCYGLFQVTGSEGQFAATNAASGQLQFAGLIPTNTGISTIPPRTAGGWFS